MATRPSPTPIELRLLDIYQRLERIGNDALSQIAESLEKNEPEANQRKELALKLLPIAQELQILGDDVSLQLKAVRAKILVQESSANTYIDMLRNAGKFIFKLKRKIGTALGIAVFVVVPYAFMNNMIFIGHPNQEPENQYSIENEVQYERRSLADGPSQKAPKPIEGAEEKNEGEGLDNAKATEKEQIPKDEDIIKPTLKERLPIIGKLTMTKERKLEIVQAKNRIRARKMEKLTGVELACWDVIIKWIKKYGQFYELSPNMQHLKTHLDAKYTEDSITQKAQTEIDELIPKVCPVFKEEVEDISPAEMTEEEKTRLQKKAEQTRVNTKIGKALQSSKPLTDKQKEEIKPKKVKFPAKPAQVSEVRAYNTTRGKPSKAQYLTPKEFAKADPDREMTDEEMARYKGALTPAENQCWHFLARLRKETEPPERLQQFIEENSEYIYDLELLLNKKRSYPDGHQFAKEDLDQNEIDDLFQIVCWAIPSKIGMSDEEAKAKIEMKETRSDPNIPEWWYVLSKRETELTEFFRLSPDERECWSAMKNDHANDEYTDVQPEEAHLIKLLISKREKREVDQEEIDKLRKSISVCPKTVPQEKQEYPPVQKERTPKKIRRGHTDEVNTYPTYPTQRTSPQPKKAAKNLKKADKGFDHKLGDDRDQITYPSTKPGDIPFKEMTNDETKHELERQNKEQIEKMSKEFTVKRLTPPEADCWDYLTHVSKAPLYMEQYYNTPELKRDFEELESLLHQKGTNPDGHKLPEENQTKIDSLFKIVCLVHLTDDQKTQRAVTAPLPTAAPSTRDTAARVSLPILKKNNEEEQQKASPTEQSQTQKSEKAGQEEASPTEQSQTPISEKTLRTVSPDDSRSNDQQKPFVEMTDKEMAERHRTDKIKEAFKSSKPLSEKEKKELINKDQKTKKEAEAPQSISKKGKHTPREEEV